MRTRLGYLAAVIATLGALLPMRVTGDETSLGDSWGEFVLVLTSVTAVAVVLTIAYAHGALRNGWAAFAIVLYVGLGIAAGTAAYLAPFGAAVALGAAMAAGDPLPPTDRSDDRLNAPFVRRED